MKRGGLSQYEEARRLLRLRNMGIVNPQSKLSGMGGKKKTRRVKKTRRSTRRRV